MESEEAAQAAKPVRARNLLANVDRTSQQSPLSELKTRTLGSPFMETDKRRLIKDPVWGNVELFRWENAVINHFLFGRLHNIVQNSSAFKVYPGLKYSRFLHSIGVAHVATQVFLNSVINATDASQKALLKEAKTLGSVVLPQARADIEGTIQRALPCRREYCVMLASIRLAALLHDIGHLPYSHVFENAVDGFRSGEYEGILRVTKTGRSCREKLNNLLKPYEHGETKLHELLGGMFVKVLRSVFVHDSCISALLQAAEQVLWSQEASIARGFLTGTIDADRIDFVKRDGFFSGLFNSSVDFGRLFSFYEVSLDQLNQVWRPRPSSRAASEKEKLLFERFQDYKYIVVHHRVHLYDEIMENIIVRLMADGTLSAFVDNLCSLLEFIPANHMRTAEQADFICLLRSILTTFDDPWVETTIRKEFMSTSKRDS